MFRFAVQWFLAFHNKASKTCSLLRHKVLAAQTLERFDPTSMSCDGAGHVSSIVAIIFNKGPAFPEVDYMSWYLTSAHDSDRVQNESTRFRGAILWTNVIINCCLCVFPVCLSFSLQLFYSLSFLCCFVSINPKRNTFWAELIARGTLILQVCAMPRAFFNQNKLKW